MKLIKALVLFSLVIIISFLVSHYTTYVSYRSLVLAQLGDRIDTISITIPKSVEAHLGQKREHEIQREFDDAVSARRHVKSVSYTIDNYIITASSDRAKIGKPVPLDFMRVGGSVSGEMENGNFKFCYPIRYFDGDRRVDGKVFLELDKGYILGQINDRAKEAIAKAFVVEFSVLIFLVLLVFYFAIRPLYKMIELVESGNGKREKFWIQELSELYLTIQKSFEELKNQKKVLQTEKQKIEALLKTIPDLVWLKNSDGIYLFCNPMFERFFGAKESQIVGKSDYDFVDVDLADFFRQKDKDAMDKGTPSVNEEWITFADDGHRALLETIKTPVYGSEGQVVGILGIARDITAIRQANEKLREKDALYSAIVSQAAEAIVLIELDGMRFKEFNDAACQKLGYSREEFAKLTLKELQADNFDDEMMRVKMQELMEKGCGIFEHSHKCKDGTLRDVVASNKVVELDNKTFIIALWHDMTEIKQMQTNLQELNKNLESKVEEETSKRLQAEQAMFTRTKMVLMGEVMGMVAHHWRQPLNALGITIQDMPYAYKAGELNYEYLQDAVESSMRHIYAMSKTIDDFKNFFSPSTFKREFCIEDATLSVLNIARPSLDEQGIKVATNLAQKHYLHGYESELKQVMLNIISNAKDALAESSSQEKIIEIDMQEDGGYLVLSIEDSGKGISPDIIDRVFEPYFTTKEQGKGIGIGLYMAKQLVERHSGGSLGVRNGKMGARFEIRLRVAQNCQS